MSDFEYAKDNTTHFARHVALANMLTLRSGVEERLRGTQADEIIPLVASMKNLMIKANADGGLMLPNLSAFGNKSIGIFSDYAGEGSGNYFTYSFLVCAFDLRKFFCDEMQSVRSTLKIAQKEIAFKDFRMGSMRALLPHYLMLLDNKMPGLLFTLMVDKKICSVVNHNSKNGQKNISEILLNSGYGRWKPQIAEKLMRIVHVSAYLISTLGNVGQKIFWMSDHDAICPNVETHRRILSLLDSVLPIYSGDREKFVFLGGAAPFAERDIALLDLLSAADIASSSIEHCMTSKSQNSEGKIFVKDGADAVLNWLCHNGIALKKFTMMIYKDKSEKTRCCSLDFKSSIDETKHVHIPIFKI